MRISLASAISVFLVSIPCVLLGSEAPRARQSESPRKLPALTVPLVVTQEDAPQDGGGRLSLVRRDGSVRILTSDFFAARDPEISFDATRILFSARRTPDDRWAVYEMGTDGSNLRKVIDIEGDCRSPRYLSTLYTIVSDKPWYQIVFVREVTGRTALYSCKLDGSEPAQLTYNLAYNETPFLLPDGRLLFGVRYPVEGHPPAGSIFGINIDGTDYAAFLGPQGRRLNRMPCTTSRGLIVFVESNEPTDDGGGSLASVHIRRPLHTYRAITKPNEGRYHSPATGPVGTVLVSRRSSEGGDTYGVVLLDPKTRRLRAVFDDRERHDLQAQLVVPRPEPDGRSSVVTAKDPYGELYCLDAAVSDDPEVTNAVTNKVARSVRFIEGIAAGDDSGLPGLEQRVLGEVPLEKDGSFSVKVPANQPIRIELLDNQGKTLRSCRWIWARNREPRGCIGCHEDGELTPENLFVDAMKKPSILLRKMESEDSRHDEHAHGESE